LEQQQQPATEVDDDGFSEEPLPDQVEDNEEDAPLLFVDVNLGSEQKRIVVYEGDQASELA
jgi:hypothetical protein